MATRAPDTLTPATSWSERARCKDSDPDIFEDARNVAEARSICARCPVTRQCLDDILRIEGNATARNRSGVYAGLTPNQRRQRYERGRTTS